MKINIELDRTVVMFFVIFMTVYFLESIGGFYMTSVVVSIEKQFQIPSKISGTMIAAGDFGYIPSVVFIAYLGGKGNRARWIGAGCILIGIANLMVSSSNFLFDPASVKINSSLIQEYINVHQSECINFNETELNATTAASLIQQYNTVHQSDRVKKEISNETELNTATAFLKMVTEESEVLNSTQSKCLNESQVRLLMVNAFAFCDDALNDIRKVNKELGCTDAEASHLGPTSLIFAGLFILGIGRTMPFSLGLPLIDDNVKRKNLPMYFVLGYSMGSFFNKYYTSDFFTSNPPAGVTPRDPLWIGKWWAGFLLIGAVLLGPSIALFLFPKPKERPDGRGLALVDRHIKKSEDGKAVVPEKFVDKVKDFKKVIFDVLKQPIYHGALVGRIIDVLAFKGFFVFLPKYLEIQFGIPQYIISLYMAIMGVIGFAAGVMIGSVVMRVAKLEGRRAAAWVGFCSLAAASLSFMNAGVGCTSTMTALGQSLNTSTLPEYFNSSAFNTPGAQEGGCGCDGMPIYPVCNQQQKVFYSPCHACCPVDTSFLTQEKNDSQVFTFKNCNCSETDDGLVSRDFCVDEGCDFWKIVYFINMAITGLIGGMGVTPGVLIMLRAVPPMDRSVSLGFNGFLVSLLATLPSPVLWGYIIDKFCILWDTKCDSSRGSCALYDAVNLRISLHVIYGMLRLISLVSDIYVWYHAKDLKLTMEEDEEDENKDKEEKTSDEGFFEPSKKDYLKFEKDSAETIPLASFPQNGDSLAMPVFVQSPHDLLHHPHEHSQGHKKNVSLDLRHRQDKEEAKEKTKSLPRAHEKDIA
uniref:Solute carrier organic anion transporter family member n=1 Tax=Acrobeloides nanus TaxID=290746 RepID=A0A914DWR9_9BILA